MQQYELPETVPVASIAELFGVSSRQARNLLEDAKVKPRVRGRWPLAEAVRAVLAQAREAREPDLLSAARARAINAKARQTEIALARAERELIPLDEAIAVMDEYCGAVRSELDGFPARVTRDIALRPVLEAEMNAVQARIVAKFRASAAELRDDADSEKDDAA